MEFVQPIRDKEKIELMKKSFKNDRDRFLFVLGINVALRVSDLLSLKVKDLRNRTHLVMKESKTGKEKRQIISPTLKKEINKYTKGMDSEDWLFPSRKGDKPISRVQAYRILNEVAQRVGVEEIGSHSLRKTFAFHYYQATNDIVTIQQLLNHSTPAVTLRYIGVNQDIMDEKLKDFSL
ncbi:site-specific integrase [Cytobacillus sp. NJ13]|nr:site-specific integrase [Cytobacillus sp. NJ13]